MPVEWRLHVLGDRLKRDHGDVFTLQTHDLYDLPSAEQQAAVDALLETEGDFPVTLVDGVAAFVGDIDADAISNRVGRALAGQDVDVEPRLLGSLAGDDCGRCC